MSDTLLRLYRPLVWISGAILLLTAFGIAVEVLVRKAFNISLGGVDELAGYGFAIFCSIAFSFAVLQKSHIRIEAVYLLMPRKVRAGLDLLALFSMVLLAGLFAWGAVGLAWDSYQTTRAAITPLATPLAIPQSAWALGFVLFGIVVTLVAGASVFALVKGDLSKFFRLAGPMSEADTARQEAVGFASQTERVD